jgi:putative nucleotidyltransferase with HDIG domain
MSVSMPGTILAQIRDLPALPEIVMELMAALRQPVVDYSRVEMLIGKDPALTTRLLKLANSSFFGLATRVSSVHAACLVLGASTITQIISALAVREQFPLDNGSVLDRKLLWQHSLGTAVAARVLAQELDMEPEQAFTAGLLHDLGKLAMDSYFSERYAQVNAYRSENRCSIEEAEMRVMGVNHRQVGAGLAEHWHLPPHLIRAIGAHGAPDEGEQDRLTDVVHVADILTQALGIGDSGNTSVPSLSAGAWERLGIGWPRLRQVLSEIEMQIEEDPFVG